MHSGCSGCDAITGAIHRARVGDTPGASGNRADCEALEGYRLVPDSAHHPCLGLDGHPPYSAVGGKKSMSRETLDELKQQIPLLDYLEAHDWLPARQLSGDRWIGLCPLHEDHKLSFLVDPGKS